MSCNIKSTPRSRMSPVALRYCQTRTRLSPAYGIWHAVWCCNLNPRTHEERRKFSKRVGTAERTAVIKNETDRQNSGGECAGNVGDTQGSWTVHVSSR